MNGSNFFYRGDGAALPDQFWSEAGPLSAAGANVNEGNQSQAGLNEPRVNTGGNSNGGSMGPYAGAVGYQSFPDIRQYPQAAPQYQVPAPQSVTSNTGHSLVGSGSNGSSPQPSGSLKKRVARACDHCRKRKIKCDTVNPKTHKCSNCTKYNARCIFKVREDLERRRRGYDLIDAAGTGHEDSNVLSFGPSASAAGNGPGLAVYEDDQLYRSISQGSFPRSRERMRSPDLNGKVEKLNMEVSSIARSLKEMEWLLGKLVDRDGKPKESEGLPRLKHKRYFTTILTPRIVTWADKRMNTYGTEKTIIAPINELLTVTLKWLMIQRKVLTDFSAPMLRDGKFQLHQLPPQAQAKRIVESFRSAMLVSSAPGLVAADYYSSLINEFYSGKSLSYAELLLLHVSICFGASRMRIMNAGDSYTVRKDRYDPSKEELQTIEQDSLLNAIYYYNKVSIGGPSVIATQGLMLLSLHLKETLDTSLAFGIFSTAVRFAFALGLNERSSYKNLTLEEEMIRRSVWWHCANTDKWFSLIQSQPPLIKEEDMDMLSDDNYFEYMTRLLKLKSPVVAEEVEKLIDLQETLDYVINYCEFLPTYISYFSLKLTRIEARMVQSCFSVESTTDCAFDTMIDRLLRLRDELKDWDENLHPAMQLSSYKNYISLLYVRDAAENPALTYEVACSRVIRCHFRSMHSRVLLGLFAISFLVDNAGSLRSSRHPTASIYNLFLNDNVEVCMRMLKLFQTVDYERHMYTGLLYCLLTGVFALFLSIIKNDQEEEMDKITRIIALLVSTHSHLVGESGEYAVSDNPKWNTSIFFYTILLSATITYYQERTLQTDYFALSIEAYDSMLTRIIEHSTAMKDRCLDRLISYIECFKLTENRAKSSPKDLASDEAQTSPQLLAPLHSPFVDTSESTLSFFRSSKPFELSSKPGLGYKDLDQQIHPDGSLFRTEGPLSFKFLEMSEIEASNQQSDGKSQTFSSRNTNQFSSDFQDLFFPYVLFYDRDLAFSKVLAERLVPLS